MSLVQSVDAPAYAADDDAVIAHAIRILESRARKPGVELTSVRATKDLLRLRFGGRETEAFAVVLLDAQHCLIDVVTMFTGTLSQTSVYPREVVRTALDANAAAVILAHNHPSGSTEPSRADELLTHTLKQALALVDIRVLDHIVVSATGATSFAERGLL